MKPMTERDEKGRITHKRWGDGNEFWYDADGHITHTRLIDGTEFWYDADGRVTKWKD
jgi:YD repeat-containing protein